MRKRHKKFHKGYSAIVTLLLLFLSTIASAPTLTDVVEHCVIGASKEFGLNPVFVRAIIMLETKGGRNWYAVSSAGALGIMQILPATGKAIANKLGIKWKGDKILFVPEYNIRIGCCYYASLRKKFKDEYWALAAYFNGPNGAAKLIKENLPSLYATRVIEIAENATAPVKQTEGQRKRLR